MNSTKRKFNALLNGIGNKSTTSLASTKEYSSSRVDLTSTDDTDSTKKRRLRDLASDQSIPFSKTALSAMPPHMHHKKSLSLATAALGQETPKYAPWDREEFLKRLKSFSSLTHWTPKPARVNEVEWAKRGWVCQKLERVRCSLCNVEILVKLNRKEVDGKEEPVYVAQNIEDALVDKYVELIVDSHEENCLWRKRGCDDSIFKLPLNHAPTTLQTLRERYDELCTREDTLPYMFNMQTPASFSLDTARSYLPSDFFRDPAGAPPSEIVSSRDMNRVAFLMALFGWQGHSHPRLGDQVGSVSCQACFRVLGLWLFKSKEVNDLGEEVVRAPVKCLDVVREHRDYCPWKNSFSQNGQKTTPNSSSTAMPGWEIVLRVLKNDHHLRMSGEGQGAKSTKPAAPKWENENPIEAENADVGDAESIREENDKKRWARLRRVKSLFDTKGGKRSDNTKTKTVM